MYLYIVYSLSQSHLPRYLVNTATIITTQKETNRPSPKLRSFFSPSGHRPPGLHSLPYFFSTGFGSGSGLGTGGAIAISESHTVGFLLEKEKKKKTDVNNLYQQKTKTSTFKITIHKILTLHHLTLQYLMHHHQNLTKQESPQ